MPTNGLPHPGGADSLMGDLFGVSGIEQGGTQTWGAAAEAQAKAFTEALAYIERHQIPVTRPQAAGLAFLRMLDGGRGVYAPIADEAERLRLHGGPAKDFVAALEAIALAARPRLMQLGGKRR